MSNNSWRNILRSSLKYNRSDRNAIIIISICLFVSILSVVVVYHLQPVSNSDFTKIKAMLDEWEKTEENVEPEQNLSLFNFNPNTIDSTGLDSLLIPDFVKRNLLAYRKAGGKFNSPEDVQKIYGMNDSVFTTIEKYIQIEKQVEPAVLPEPVKISLVNFDPNTASAEELERLGFSSYQANNLISYRENGGVFKTAEDVSKIYGIDSVFFYQIRDYIVIPATEEPVVVEPIKEILIELNAADSTDLVQLKGIGASYARRIMKYRNLLGGYYSKEQLKEVYNFPLETYTQIQPFVYIDTTQITPLRINFAEFSDLLRHPYINKTQVKAILNKRETDGPIKSIEDLKTLEAFDSETIEKIRPYLTCR